MNYIKNIILSIALSIGFTSNTFTQNQDFIKQYEKLEKIFEKTDIISPTVWREEVAPTIQKIERFRSPELITQTQELLDAHSALIYNTISSVVTSFFQDIDVQELISSIAVGTLVGALPLVALTALSASAGNVDPSAIVNTLVDVGSLSALDSLIRYLVKQRVGELKMAGISAVGSTSALNLSKDTIKNISQLLGTQQTFTQSNPISGGLIAIGTAKATQIITNNGGFGPLLRAFDWKEFAVGSFPETDYELAMIDPAYHSFYSQVKQQLSRVVNNREVRQATAQIMTHALEGVVIGGITYALGLGYSDETLVTTLSYSMLRGGIEGLARYSAKKLPMSGVVQRIGTGFIGRQIQKTLTHGTNLLDIATTDITPTIAKQVVSSAVNTIVRQHRGWKNVITSTLDYARRGWRGSNQN